MTDCMWITGLCLYQQGDYDDPNVFDRSHTRSYSEDSEDSFSDEANLREAQKYLLRAQDLLSDADAAMPAWSHTIATVLAKIKAQQEIEERLKRLVATSFTESDGVETSSGGSRSSSSGTTSNDNAAEVAEASRDKKQKRRASHLPPSPPSGNNNKKIFRRKRKQTVHRNL